MSESRWWMHDGLLDDEWMKDGDWMDGLVDGWMHAGWTVDRLDKCILGCRPDPSHTTYKFQGPEIVLACNA